MVSCYHLNSLSPNRVAYCASTPDARIGSPLAEVFVGSSGIVLL